MEQVKLFWAFYANGIAFMAVGAAVWAIVHETAKYAWKRWVLRVPYK